MEAEGKAETAGPARKRKPMDQVVVREFPQIGRYRVRLVRESREGAPLHFDVREYAVGASFEGFTRKGIRLAGPDDLARLREAIDQALEAMTAA